MSKHYHSTLNTEKAIFRANGDTLSEEEFNARRAVIQEVVVPTVSPYVLVSEGTNPEDPFARELAVRERANRVGILQVTCLGLLF